MKKRLRIYLVSLACLGLLACGVIADVQEKVDSFKATIEKYRAIAEQLRTAQIKVVNGRLVITVRNSLPKYISKPLRCEGYAYSGELYDSLTGEKPLFSVDLRGLRKDAEEYLKQTKQGQAGKPKLGEYIKRPTDEMQMQPDGDRQYTADKSTTGAPPTAPAPRTIQSI